MAEDDVRWHMRKQMSSDHYSYSVRPLLCGRIPNNCLVNYSALKQIFGTAPFQSSPEANIWYSPISDKPWSKYSVQPYFRVALKQIFGTALFQSIPKQIFGAALFQSSSEANIRYSPISE